MLPQNKEASIPAAHAFDPVILREYDIRGQIDKNLSVEDAYALGLAFGTFVRRKTGKDKAEICVGFDGRHSSPALSDALIKGLKESGNNVTCVGIGPTPMLYFAVKSRKADAGVMVTGSHNPSDYNGFKMTLQKALSLARLFRRSDRLPPLEILKAALASAWMWILGLTMWHV